MFFRGKEKGTWVNLGKWAVLKLSRRWEVGFVYHYLFRTDNVSRTTNFLNQRTK
jgi:hypothetical protein